MLPEWFMSPSEEAAFLRLLLDHVSDCLVAVNTAGTVILINEPYCKLLGGEADDFVGRHITEIIGPQTKLHLVASGVGTHIGYPLVVRGHHLVTKQVPVQKDGSIVGAVGLALFSDFDTLKKTYSRIARAELAVPNSKTSWRARFGMEDIVGQGAVMESYRNSLRLAAAYDVPVLISGETGSGKELAANAIHTLSSRSEGPFVWINCASIPRELIEAELFGYEAGAFTGAHSRGKPGKFELASGGVLFLDEIGDMPPPLQGSLLRILQTNEIARIGGTTPTTVDVRIVCATHRSLAGLVESGHFREDLYYRLNVLPVDVPALRERDDISFLAQQLVARISSRLGTSPITLDATDQSLLTQHSWPGNIRELENVLTRFIVTGKLVLPRTAALSEPKLPVSSLKQQIQLATVAEIHSALQRSGGNKRRAAELLGISRAHFYRMLKEYNLQSGDLSY